MRNYQFILILLCLLCISPSLALSHGGRLAADGCHFDHSKGTRHCHGSGDSSSTDGSSNISGAKVLHWEKSKNKGLLSYELAKDELLKIHEKNSKTFYCDCDFANQKPDHSSCGYIPNKDSERAYKIEWEHIVPRSKLLGDTSSWYDGHKKCVDSKGEKYHGWKCSRKTDEDFRLMESDMYNIVPVIGEVNAKRRNYNFGEVEGEPRDFGGCDFEVEEQIIRRKKVMIAEPAKKIRGDIARVYLYMTYVYGSKFQMWIDEKQLMRGWDNQDPSVGWEFSRARLIELIQGDRNSILYRRYKNLI